MERILKLKSAGRATEICNTVVVVPCFNEADRLPVKDFHEFVRKNQTVRFLFVNDGSHDETVVLLEQLATETPDRFEFLDLVQNGGKAEAIRQGFLHSLRFSKTEYIGFWDADLSTPLEEIPRFLETLQARPELNMVIGTRMALLGRHVYRKPIRKLLGKLFATVASVALGLKIQDTQCGAKLFRVTPELVQAFSDPFISKWIFDVEVIARYLQLRKNQISNLSREFIYEQPLEAWEEVGSSRLKSSDFLTAIFDLTRIYWTNILPGSTLTAKSQAVTIPMETDVPLESPVQPTERKAA